MIGRVVRGYFIVVGVLATLLVIALIIAGVSLWRRQPTVPQRAVLVLNLDHPILERMPHDPLGRLVHRDGIGLWDLVTAIDRAGADDRVRALFASGGTAAPGFAMVQELRDAVARFRATGKPAIFFADTFGEMQPGNQAYYLASAFESIWLQPSGSVALTGLLAEAPFFKGTADLFDVKVQGDQRKEYKSALEVATRRDMSTENRQATRVVLEDLAGQMANEIAADRNLAPDAIIELMNQAPVMARAALQARLIDRIGYRAEAVKELGQTVEAEIRPITPQIYLTAHRPRERPDRLALIYGTGPVARGGAMPPMSGEVMAAEVIEGAFRQAIDDPSVRAIVFRVSSPGGSYVASDTIWHQTRRARDAGKPVVVSMGNVAGSGGYFVSMAATRIVAQPATLTGSIGVVLMKPNLRGLFKRLGVTFDHVQVGENAEMFSLLHSFDDRSWQRVQDWLDEVYRDFVAKVAEGRKLPPEKVEDVARGRIWSGARARDLGLVDDLGGLHKAIALARAAAQIPDDREISLVILPEERHFLQLLLAGDGIATAVRAAAGVVPAGVPRLLDEAARDLHAWVDRGALAMPPVSVGP